MLDDPVADAPVAMETALVRDRAGMLRHSPLWSSLDEEARRAIGESMEPCSWKAGDLVIRQGEPGDRLHMLVTGELEVRVRMESGVVVPVARLKPGDCLGEMSLLTGDEASADVAAVAEAETLTLDRGAFNALLDRYPSLLREVVTIVSRRLRATDAALVAEHENREEITRFLAREGDGESAALIGKDKAMRALQKRIAAETSNNTPLLILGEKGTGKEAVANRIHYEGPRKDAPLLATDCGRIRETRWGDQLFGDFHRPDPGKARVVCLMDLAEGGTLFLKNIERLPKPVMDRLARYLEREGIGGRRRDVRIVATMRDRSGATDGAADLLPDLPAAMTDDPLRVPPLRERKKDIPLLARHFLERHTARIQGHAKDFDDQALRRLITHDYRFANVRELEEAVQRAAVIAHGESVASEEVFLGAGSTPRPRGVNLLRLPRGLVDFVTRAHPTWIRALAAAVFAGILFLCFFSPTTAGERLALGLVWALWWPALALSFLLLGRAWCAVCPMALSGSLVQRLSSARRKVPGWMKNREALIATAGFFLILWIEESTDMRHSAFRTGLLLLGIMGGAMLTGFLYPRRTWCRHLCPLGGFASLCSTSAVVEVRPTPDICAAKCSGHLCYSGTDEVEGCPMFQHVMFVDTNRNCVLCLNCVKACENGSPQINLRLPVQELWDGSGARPEVARAVAMFLGLALSLAVIGSWETRPVEPFSGWLETNRFLLLSAVMPLVTALPLLTLLVAERRTPEEDRPRLWSSTSAWLPVVVAAFAAFQVRFVPGLEDLQTGVRLEDGAGGWSRVLPLVQGALLFGGLALATAIQWKARSGEGGRARRLLAPAGLLVATGVFAIALFPSAEATGLGPGLLAVLLLVFGASHAVSLAGPGR